MERGCKVKMAKYHQFLKYFAKKKKTLSEKNSDLSLFLVLELTSITFFGTRA